VIKVHAFYCFNSDINWVTFVFQDQDGNCRTFNSDCWEDGKPVLRKVKKVHYDIMGTRLSHHYNGWSNAPVLNIVMDNGEEFETMVDEHQQFVACGDYYLGVAVDPFEIHANACAFGADPRLRGWATRGLDFRRHNSLRSVALRLEKFGLSVGREPGSNTAYPEEFGWVLDYSTGKLIDGCGTENQLVTSS
jgi:hypothetical protein